MLFKQFQNLIDLKFFCLEFGRWNGRGRQKPEGQDRGAHVKERTQFKDFAQEGRVATDSQGAEATARGYRCN